MDDQIRRLMTNQATFDRFRRPVEISQASLMPLGVAQCHSAVDTDIPGIITMHIVLFTVPIFLGAKTRFCIDSKVICAPDQAGISPNQCCMNASDQVGILGGDGPSARQIRWGQEVGTELWRPGSGGDGG